MLRPPMLKSRRTIHCQERNVRVPHTVEVLCNWPNDIIYKPLTTTDVHYQLSQKIVQTRSFIVLQKFLLRFDDRKLTCKVFLREIQI